MKPLFCLLFLTYVLMPFIAVDSKSTKITLKNFFDFATDSLKKIPVVGDILSSTNDGDEILESLNQIKSFLKIQEKTLSDISFKLDIKPFTDQIREITKQIQSCFTNLQEYKELDSSFNRDRFLACSGNIEDDVRDIIRIVEGETRFSLEKELFQTLYDFNGQCDGNMLLPTYNYLFSEYYVGCAVLINGAKLKYPNETAYVEECKRGFLTFLSKMGHISNFCADKECYTHEKQIKNLWQNSQNNKKMFLEKASTKMFWFEFILTEPNANLEIVNEGVDTIPNKVVIGGYQIFYKQVSLKGMGQLSNVTTDNDNYNKTCFAIRDLSEKTEFTYNSSSLSCTWECEENKAGITFLYAYLKISSCTKIFRCCSKFLVSTNQKCSFSSSSSLRFNFEWYVLSLLLCLFMK